MHEAELQPHDLTSYIDAIRLASRPCLAGRISDSDCDSYFGGMPLVAPGFEWPTKDGYPLAFVGQLHCSDIKLVPANEGDLLFFYDNRHWGYSPKDLGHAVVIHQQSTDQRIQPELPSRLASTLFGLRKKTVKPKVYQRVDVAFTDSCSYPSYERKLITFADDVGEECYMEFCEAIVSEIQIGGYPWPIQSDWMELDCVKAFEPGQPDDWVLLLQLFEVGDMMWGDGGALYWFIHRDDLNVNRFDRVWMVSQCHQGVG